MEHEIVLVFGLLDLFVLYFDTFLFFFKHIVNVIWLKNMYEILNLQKQFNAICDSADRQHWILLFKFNEICHAYLLVYRPPYDGQVC